MEKITIELISRSNAIEVLEFERENRQFFESTLPSRGDKYYEEEFFMEIIEEIIEEQTEGQCYMYVIRNELGKVVGRVNLFSVVRGMFEKAEIGYRIGQKHNGKGYATKAVELAIDEGFNKYNLHRIEAGTSPNNIGSQIVLIKNGFQFIGRTRDVIRINNKWEDGILFERLNNK
ncbi:GNAT family N-acetyltransferase [Clostridium sp. D2Q-11]|uniref:GNAT family N-acetyltransferase n=1 Tax=Anaeromonas frigoriresistens TaxID=2683708 RepID=A0A942Z7Q2_9FIRM|nr:GNAT family protein [Anaeromonas frigoriresistens]MBS4537488.1 GNAT family N-acetyltransferase [Anaeromonas frigoriresistens]